jgi:predicted DCC family thiol-disulfide oxidoreductase YuxK
MARPSIQAPSVVEGAHLVLYDGVCGLCNRLLQFLFAHDRRAVFRFASLQSPVGRATVARFGGNPDELTTFYVVADYRTDRARIVNKSRAALFVARELGWPWRAVMVMAVLPKPILDRIYDAIAQSRYRLFGRVEHCMIPTPELRRRFIDQ